ncbi:unnamed protein product [Caenorhabditis bovis]|uniref:Sm domain-containing protein n=1 Tax=Caenorhabditis bovis TaxID=2654633 RepID=A0A8S1F8G8_9PELO|nr:unnamed protein product [Caenorhabditis bovis]
MEEPTPSDLICVEKNDNLSEAEKAVKEYLGKRYEVWLTDGRIVRGTLVCTDKDANMVFIRTDERWRDSQDMRWTGQAMIAKRHVTGMYLLPPPPPSAIPTTSETAE